VRKMNPFLYKDKTIESQFRAVYLFGRNVATYKFAFAKTILELGGGVNSFVSLADLSPVYAKYMLEHIDDNKRQILNPTSKFISALELFNNSQITWDQLLDVTQKVGFRHVIDAFHNIPEGELSTSFYEKAVIDGKPGITLTDDAFQLSQSLHKNNLFGEIEGRWNLVENVWTERNSRFKVDYDADLESFFFIRPITSKQFLHSHERINLTPVRKPLNGYQKGKCFYCFNRISIESNQLDTCDVDHFIPLSIQHDGRLSLNLNEAWNLVLSCKDCNRGEDGGKFAQLPTKTLLERLHKRNEYLIKSEHPLQQTIIQYTGRSPQERRRFLDTIYSAAKSINPNSWAPRYEYDVGF